MEPMLTLALAKGRLAEQTFDLLERMGINCDEARHPGRQLVLWDHASDIRFILVKPSDVPTYVEYGAADIGIIGNVGFWTWYGGWFINIRCNRQGNGYTKVTKCEKRCRKRMVRTTTKYEMERSVKEMR